MVEGDGKDSIALPPNHRTFYRFCRTLLYPAVFRETMPSRQPSAGPLLALALICSLALTACGSKGPLVLPPAPDGQAKPGANPNTPAPSYPQPYTQIQTYPQ